MKIKAKNPKAVAGIRLIVPVDGLIAIDSEGAVEVSEACAEALVNGTSDWEYAEPKKTAPADEGEKPAEEEEGEEETPAAEPTEREKFEKELKSMTVVQMKKLCADGGLPEAEWKNLNKSLLSKYILSKYDALTAAEEEESEEEEEETAAEGAPATSAESAESEEEELEEEEEEEEPAEEEEK